MNKEKMKAIKRKSRKQKMEKNKKSVMSETKTGR